MLFFPQLSPIPACNRPTTWSLLPFCLVSPKHRQLPLVWAGVGDSARTEHAPLIPQPSLKHPIPAKTPFRQPHARHVAPQPGSHCAPPAPARRLPPFWALPQRPAQGLSLGRGGPRGSPAAPGRSSGSSSRLPALGLRGCWAARPAPLRLVLRVVLPGLVPRQLVCRLPCPVVSLSGGALASGALVVFVG